MKTQSMRIEVEEVKVVEVMIDLGSDLDRYKSNYLALKNHERGTDYILEVRNFWRNNHVCVILMIDENEDTDNEVKKCLDYCSQFGEVIDREVTTAYILDQAYNNIFHRLDEKFLYLYN